MHKTTKNIQAMLCGDDDDIRSYLSGSPRFLVRDSPCMMPPRISKRCCAATTIVTGRSACLSACLSVCQSESQNLPQAPRSSQKLSEAPTSSQKLPQAPRSSQKLKVAIASFLFVPVRRFDLFYLHCSHFKPAVPETCCGTLIGRFCHPLK